MVLQNAQYIAAAFAGAVTVWAVVVYNRFVSLRRYKEEAWSGIEVQLKRRHDLVPNLVEVVKGYARHEKELLNEVVASRAMPRGNDPAERAVAESAFSHSLGRVFALAEAYPELKADANFVALHNSLNEIEESLQLARRYFNGAVRDYNIRVESFPSLIIARLFSFSAAPFFELESREEAAVPKVSF